MTIILFAGGRLGFDQTIHDICIKHNIQSRSYVPNYWKYNEKIYKFIRCDGFNESACDIKMLDEADSLISIRFNISNTEHNMDKLVNYSVKKKYEYKKINPPLLSHFYYEIINDNNYGNYKPVIVIWILDINYNIDNIANVLNKFMKEHNIQKPMFSGSFENVENVEKILEKLLEKLDLIRDNTSFAKKLLDQYLFNI